MPRKEKRNGKHKRTTLLHIKIKDCLIALLTFFMFSNVFLFLLIKKKKKGVLFLYLKYIVQLSRSLIKESIHLLNAI